MAQQVCCLWFTEAKTDISLFIYHGTEIVYLLLYVDDIVLTACGKLLNCVIDALKKEFAMKDLGPLHHFLGVAVERHRDTLFLSQRHYWTFLPDMVLLLLTLQTTTALWDLFRT
jgi:hypothetical protein